MSGHCLFSQLALVTWRSLGPFPGSYITPARKPLIVLFAQAGFSKCGWMGGGLNHTVYSLSNKPAVCHPSHHWSHPLSGPRVCPPSPSVLLASRGTVCFDWDLCHLWLLNHVDTRVIHAWRGCLCLDPNRLFNTSSGLLGFVFFVIAGVWGGSLLKELCWRACLKSIKGKC